MRVLAVLLILFTTAARASDGSLLSTHLMLPVTISGNELPLESFVVRPDHPGRFPLVLVTHGTPGVDGDAFFREILNRSPVGYSKAAVAFAQRGYAVVSIMRRGFGRSGGGFSESLRKACDYLPAVRVSAEDVIAAVISLRKEPWVDADHVILLGHSTGGLAVTAAAAENPAGVVGILNFDGGEHALSASGQACEPDNLVNTMAALGRTARVPELWIYAENDQSYGPDLARRMFGAYTAGGAPAQLRVLPPFGENGHDLVMAAPADNWFSSVEPFLAGLALPTAPAVSLPLFAELPIPPGALPVCQKGFANYLANPDDAKAFAVSRQGGCGTGAGRTVDEARENAVTACKINTRGADCKLYAIGQHLAGN
jgi:dienelactone hydrolase